MNDDLIERLRRYASWRLPGEGTALALAAVDEIERLREAVRYLFTEEWPKGFDPGDLAAPDHVEAAIRRAMEGNQ